MEAVRRMREGPPEPEIEKLSKHGVGIHLSNMNLEVSSSSFSNR